ncbi:MAG: dual specificity protein phosphatase family protein [Thermodesulfovibrionales bacterium]
MSKKVPGRFMSVQPDYHKLPYAAHSTFSGTTGPSKSIISWRKFIIAVVSLLFILAGSLFLYIEEQGNFHSITPGEAYRSAQMDRDELEYYILKHHLKSILNLRGKDPDSDWYIEEVKVSSEYGIVHYDMALSASRELTAKEGQTLIEIFHFAPRPILIHCKSGADRSGLVSAMWKVIVDKNSKAEAKKQLSILYGHIPIGPTSAMDQFFERWRPELRPYRLAAEGVIP